MNRPMLTTTVSKVRVSMKREWRRAQPEAYFVGAAQPLEYPLAGQVNSRRGPGPSLGRSSAAHIMGVVVRDTTSETRMAADRVTAEFPEQAAHHSPHQQERE